LKSSGRKDSQNDTDELHRRIYGLPFPVVYSAHCPMDKGITEEKSI
jgi:hypothetical protein